MQALHNGAWLVLDFDTVDCDLASSFDKVPLASLLFISPVSFFGCERSAFDQHLMTVVCDRLWMFVVWTWLMAFEHGLWWLSHHPSSRTTFQKWCCLRTSCSSKRAMRDFYVHRMSLLPRSVWLPWLSMVIGYPLATLHLLSASPRPVPDALFLVGDLRAPSCAGWRCISGASANSRCQEPLVHGCSRGCGKRFFCVCRNFVLDSCLTATFSGSANVSETCWWGLVYMFLSSFFHTISGLQTMCRIGRKPTRQRE